MTRRLADRRERRRRTILFWGLLALVVLYGFLGGDHRPHHLLKLALEERQTEARIAKLEERKRALEAKRDSLAEDPFTLEALAREKGMILPGDIVYHILPVSPGIQRAAVESLAARTARQAREARAAAADSIARQAP